MKISKVQWRALKTIRGSRRTVASTARFVPPNTLASLRKRDWIYLAPFEGSDADMPGYARGRPRSFKTGCGDDDD